MKTVYRLPPCPSFDIEATESWLYDMSRKGLHLSGEGFFAGVAIFDRGEPADIRYRLEAAPEDTGMLSANGGQPDPDAVALNADGSLFPHMTNSTSTAPPTRTLRNCIPIRAFRRSL